MKDTKDYKYEDRMMDRAKAREEKADDDDYGEKVHPLVCECGRADCPDKDENIPPPCGICGAREFELVHKSHHEYESVERDPDAHLGAHENHVEEKP